MKIDFMHYIWTIVLAGFIGFELATIFYVVKYEPIIILAKLVTENTTPGRSIARTPNWLMENLYNELHQDIP